jgi:biopolymer transport protein ExbD
MNFRPRRKEELDVNITPLIDVVFLLLIFFMVSTTFEHTSEIEIMLPKASVNQPPEADAPIDVTVSAEGAFFINNRRLVNTRLETLKQALTDAAGGRKTPPIIVSADAQTPHQAVVTVMDAARQLGFVKLSFATSQLNGAE